MRGEVQQQWLPDFLHLYDQKKQSVTRTQIPFFAYPDSCKLQVSCSVCAKWLEVGMHSNYCQLRAEDT